MNKRTGEQSKTEDKMANWMKDDKEEWKEGCEEKEIERGEYKERRLKV